MEKYKEYIGYRFVVSSSNIKPPIEYIFGKIKSGKPIIFWKKGNIVKNEDSYTFETIHKFVNKGSWILEERYYREQKLKRILKWQEN